MINHIKVNVFETLQILSNGEAKMANFAIDAFVFNDQSTNVYFHCNVNVCDATRQNCTKDCSAGDRRKRSSGDNDDRTATIGPIRIDP